MISSYKNYEPDPSKIAEILDQRMPRYHRFGLFILLFYGVFSVLMSYFYERWTVAIIGTIFIIGSYLFMVGVVKAKSFVFHYFSVMLIANLALITYLLDGIYYAHFVYFISMSLVMVFGNLRVAGTYAATGALFYAFIFYAYYTGNKEVSDVFLKIEEMKVGQESFSLVFIAWLGQIYITVLFTEIIRKHRLRAITLTLFMEDHLNIDGNIQFAQEISKGNVNSELEVKEGDILGHTLKEMQEILKKKNTEDEMHQWVSAGIQSLNSLLLSVSDINKISHKLLREILRYLSCYQGAFYMVVEEDGQEYVELKSCYAFDRRKQVENRIKLGEGLLGDAILKGKTIVLNNVPESYRTIVSGLGEERPKQIVIVPLVIKGKVLGGIEVSSFTELSEQAMRYLDSVSENISAVLLSLQSTQRTKVLLEESEKINQKLLDKEFEMRDHLQKIKEKEAELSQLEDSLKIEQFATKSLMGLKDYLFIKLDAHFCIEVFSEGLIKYSEGVEIEKGTNIFTVFKGKDDELKGCFQQAFNEETSSFTIEVLDENGDAVFLAGVCSPIRGLNDVVQSIWVVIKDSTDLLLKLQQTEMQLYLAEKKIYEQNQGKEEE